MTDAQIFELLDAMQGAPRIEEGRRRFIHAPGFGVVCQRRVGNGQRWSMGPSDIVPPALYRRGIIGPAWWTKAILEWARRAETLDLAAHARAMGARTL